MQKQPLTINFKNVIINMIEVRMRLIYRGGYRSMPAYNFEELKKAVESGEWFRTDAFDFYYKSVPYNSNYGEVPENIVPLKRVCVTSINSYWSSFYKLEKSDNESTRVYAGKDLEDLICKELTSWAKNLNPLTMKAFGGRDFFCYLNAIPKEIILKEGFVKRMESALKKGFIVRAKTAKQTDIPYIDGLSKLAQDSVQKIYKKRESEQFELQEKIEANFKKLQKRQEKLLK